MPLQGFHFPLLSPTQEWIQGRLWMSGKTIHVGDCNGIAEGKCLSAESEGPLLDRTRSHTQRPTQGHAWGRGEGDAVQHWRCICH